MILIRVTPPPGERFPGDLLCDIRTALETLPGPCSCSAGTFKFNVDSATTPLFKDLMMALDRLAERYSAGIRVYVGDSAPVAVVGDEARADRAFSSVVGLLPDLKFRHLVQLGRLVFKQLARKGHAVGQEGN